MSQLTIDLMVGRVELPQLSPALLQYYTFAFEDGRDSLSGSIANLQAENDKLYLRAYNSPDKIREIQQRRLDGHFAREAERFFSEVSA